MGHLHRRRIAEAVTESFRNGSDDGMGNAAVGSNGWPAIALCILLVLSSTQATAQDKESSFKGATGLSEVKVTAERRETTLQKTPVVVNVIDASELAKRNVTKLADLAGLAAGVNIPSQWPNTQSVFIRGIGSSRPIGNPSVGWYLDDVYIPRSFGSSFIGNLPDIERVEVLHGPQGTLYGQNTSSGALRIISRQPTGKPGGWVSVGAGNQGQIETRGYLTGSLAPNLLSGSLALASSHIGGDVHNLYLHKRVDGYDNKQLRGILRLTPKDTDLVATLTLDGLHGRGTSGTTPLNYPGTGARKNFSNYGAEQGYDSGGASLKLEGGLTDYLSWKSITAYRGFQVRIPSDDPYPTNLTGFDQKLHQKQYSQEFQLLGDYDRFSFVSGLMLWREVFDVNRLSWSRDAFSIIRSTSTNRSAGLYGQGTYRVTDALSLTLGLRLNKEWRGLDSAAYTSNPQWVRLARIYGLSGLSKTYDAATPKFTLDYQWTPNLMTYLTWARGETSGGWNASAASQAIALVPVNPEKVTASEIGLKSVWNDRLRNNVALFYNDYKDYQASINNPVVNGVLVTGAVVVNAGRAHTYGAEWESYFQASRKLELNLSLAYLRAVFDKFINPTGAPNTDFSGASMPYAPRWSGNVGATYTQPLGSGANLRLNANYRAESRSYSEVSANRAFTRFPSTRYLDGGAAYTTANREWTFSLIGKNLLNKTYVLPGTYVPSIGYESITYNRKRTLLLSARWDFL